MVSLPKTWLWSAAILAVAVAVRLPALYTDFWLDEIWSWFDFAQKAGSAWQIFFGAGFNHDNNHPLNTLFLYLLGEQDGWVAYRLLALVTGVVAVGAAMLLGRRWGNAAGPMTGLLFAGSFLMVIYSTEARGYGPLVCFTLLGTLTLDSYLTRPRPSLAVAFWACVFLGLASHLSLMHFYLAALLWSAVRLCGRGNAWSQRLVPFAWLHAVPILYLGVLYFVVIRSMQRGGGPPWSWQDVTDKALAWTLGYPVALVPAGLALAAVAVLLAWELRQLRREGSDQWVLYLGVIVLAPVGTLAFLAKDYMFARYFILPLTFLLLVVGRALARLWALPRWGMPLCVALLLAVAAGNGAHLVRFWDHGRGGASSAVRYMLEHSPQVPSFVASEPIPLWADLPLRYYQRGLSKMPLRLVPVASPTGFDWFILQSQERDPPVRRELTLPNGQRLALRKHYPCYGPSGMHWFLYQRSR